MTITKPKIQKSTIAIILLLIVAAMTSGCIGEAKPVEINNSSVTYTTSNSPTDGNFWMYMYMMHMFDSRSVVYVEQNHYYSSHPTSSYTPKYTDVKPSTKKESFFSKTASKIKSGTSKVGSSFKASKTGFKSTGSSYKSSSSGFKSSGSGFKSSGSSYKSSSGFKSSSSGFRSSGSHR